MENNRAYVMAGMVKHKQTLCWDCANACGGCSWSASFEPVEGWEAEPRPVAQNKGGFSILHESYSVITCPEFIRDGKNHGLDRVRRCSA